MAASTIRAVLFDAVGTLLHPDPPVVEAYAAAGRQLGSRLGDDEIATRFHRAFAVQEAFDQRDAAGATTEQRERQRWCSIVCEVFRELPDPQSAFDPLWRHFAAARHWRLDEDAATVLAVLDERGIPWGLASNFDRRLEGIVRELPPLAVCRGVFVSSQLGWRKPHRQFFAAIEQQLGMLAESLLLVGDNLENDYQAARAAGWQAILFDPPGKHPTVEPRITRLAELAARFAAMC